MVISTLSAYSDNYTNVIAFTSGSTSTNNADVDIMTIEHTGGMLAT